MGEGNPQAKTAPLDETTALSLARRIINQEVETLRELAEGLEGVFWKCAQRISECPGMVWTTGVGTSAAVAARFAHILNCCGRRSMFLHPSDSLHGHSGALRPGDLLIGMSRGGESSEVNQLVAIADQLNVSTMAFVHDTDSTLARSCQAVLPIRSRQEYELQEVLATTSTVAFCAMCDALAAVVWELRGHTLEEFRRTHPGGAVGKELHGGKAGR